MLVHQALPVVATNFPTLACELRAIGSLLEGQPGGFLSLPAGVLAAALEAVAFGGHAAGSYQRRWAALEASVFLQYEHGARPNPEDFGAAVGLWASALARAAGGYRAHAAAWESDLAFGRTSQAAPLAAVLTTLAGDLPALVAASEAARIGGRKAVLRQVATYVAHHPGMKGPATNTGGYTATPPELRTPKTGNGLGLGAKSSSRVRGPKKKLAADA